MFKPVFASILALAATAALAVSALAAGAPGPQHLNLTGQQCFVGKGTTVFCETSKGEETMVLTPSGNFSGDVNVTSSFVVTDSGTLVASGTDNLHEHILYTNNFTVVQEAGIHEVSTFTQGGSTCTLSQDLHATQLDPVSGTGHIEYSNFSIVCV
jgi:hypothetical protein